ncbi:MAG: hypothetical protein J1E63_07665 [Muribaculaceae bacterium]|nr:hypothetical protein [Muribaculaceae bacterium]
MIVENLLPENNLKPELLKAISGTPGVIYLVNVDTLSTKLPSLSGFKTETIAVAGLPSMIVSRRVGLDNIGREDYQILQFDPLDRYGTVNLLRLFKSILIDTDNDGPGDLFVDMTEEEDELQCGAIDSPCCSVSESDFLRRDEGIKISRSIVSNRVAKRSFSRMLGFGGGLSSKELHEIEENNDEQTVRGLESERAMKLKRIKEMIVDYIVTCNEMPDLDRLQQEIKDMVITDIPPSPLVINRNLDIVFPKYDELKLKLSPQLKAIYILFLMHPEGIQLKEIGDFKKELQEVLAIVRPEASENKYKLFVSEIVKPGADLLRQKISQIKRAVVTLFSESRLADYYSIIGTRGEPYRIMAAGNATIPRVFNFNA